MTNLENGSHNEIQIPFKQFCDTLIQSKWNISEIACACRYEVVGDGTGVWADVLEQTVEWEAGISIGIGWVQTRQWQGRNRRASNRDSTDIAVLSVREMKLSCFVIFIWNKWVRNPVYDLHLKHVGAENLGTTVTCRGNVSLIMFSKLVKLWIFMP